MAYPPPSALPWLRLLRRRIPWPIFLPPAKNSMQPFHLCRILLTLFTSQRTDHPLHHFMDAHVVVVVLSQDASQARAIIAEKLARNCWAPGGGAAGQGNLQNRPNTRGGFQTQRGMNPSRGRGRLVPPSHRIAATTETQLPEGVILPHNEYAEYQRWQTLQNQMPDF